MPNTPLLLIRSPRFDRLSPRITADPNDIIDIINQQEIQNYKLGIILLVIALATWIIGLELVNAVLKGDDYEKPWLFAVITGSCFSINLLPDIILVKSWSIFLKLRLKKKKKTRHYFKQNRKKRMIMFQN